MSHFIHLLYVSQWFANDLRLLPVACKRQYFYCQYLIQLSQSSLIYLHPSGIQTTKYLLSVPYSSIPEIPNIPTHPSDIQATLVFFQCQIQLYQSSLIIKSILHMYCCGTRKSHPKTRIIRQKRGSAEFLKELFRSEGGISLSYNNTS